MLPTKIKIGPMWYDVESWDPVDAHANNQLGRSCGMTHTIKVATIYGPCMTAVTLLHEIWHVIGNTYCLKGLQTGDDDLENNVDRFAVAMSQVIQDNPDLFNYIYELLESQNVSTKSDRGRKRVHSRMAKRASTRKG